MGYLPLTGPTVDPPAADAARQGELKGCGGFLNAETRITLGT